MSLSEFYRKKAEEELGENDIMKAQLLQQFRDWIKMHPYIRNCRQDDISLLLFLRSRKYSFINATKSFENCLKASITLPHFLKNLDIKDPVMDKLLDSGYVLILPNRTKDGERVLMCRPQAFDTKKYNGNDIFRINILALFSTFGEEETQISGYKYIVDCTGMTLSYLVLPKLRDLKSALDVLRNALPVRLKSIYLINLPGFAHSLLQILKTFANEKMKRRIKLFKSFEEFSSEFDVNLLPEEYGGKVSIAKITETMRKSFLEKRSAILDVIETVYVENILKLAESSCIESDEGSVGSLKNLNFD